MQWPNFIKSFSGERAKKYVGIVSDGIPRSANNWKSTDFLTANEISLYTNKAISKRADMVAEIEFVLRDKSGKEIVNDELLPLLYKPNKVFTGRQFWTLYQKYYDLVGEVFIYVEKGRDLFETSSPKIKALHLLIPNKVTPKFADDGSVTEFEYKGGKESKTYSKDEIIYIHNPNPKSPLRGVSLLQAGVSAIDTEIEIDQYHSRILKNGGKVEGVFKFPTGPLTRDQLEKVKDDYRKEYAESKKAGTPLFLGGGADYTKLGLMPDELGYLEAKKTTLEDICILTGVPKSMMGSTVDVKFDNAGADRNIFLRETIKPLMGILCEALDERLFPDDRLLTFKDPTPENTEEKRKNLETANTINALTINEKRYALKDLGIEVEPIENGDDVLIPFSMVPLGTDTYSNTETTKDFKKKDKNSHPLKDFDMRRLYWDIQIKRMDRREKPFIKALKEYFKDQENRIIEKISGGEIKSMTKAQVGDYLNLEVEVKIGKEKFTPLMIELLKQAGIDAIEFAGSMGAFTLSDTIVSWINNRADIFLRQINNTTLKQLEKDFSDSLQAEEGREGLIKRIQKTYQDTGKLRSATIARTEVHNATQYGTVQGYKQGGLQTKIWVSVMDSETRDSHAMVDGEERPIDIPFSNGLQYPGDPRGAAGEVINCRCVV